MTNPSTPAAPSVSEEGREPRTMAGRELVAGMASGNPLRWVSTPWELARAIAVIEREAAALTPASTPSHDGLAALRDALLAIPLGANGITSAGWNRYDTDDEHVLHLWSGTWEPGGQSWDLRVPKTLPAASTASTGLDDHEARHVAEIAGLLRLIDEHDDEARRGRCDDLGQQARDILKAARLVPSTEATEAAGEPR